MKRAISWPMMSAGIIGIISCSAGGAEPVLGEYMKVLASDGVADDHFGGSVALDNELFAVGSPLDDDLGINSGSVYLYDLASGVETAKLLMPGGSAGDNFGYSVAIGRGIVAVGARYDDVASQNRQGIKTGSVYLFSASTGAPMMQVLANDHVQGAEFGVSMAIGQEILAVGAHFDGVSGSQPGSAYLFDLKTGDQLIKLIASDRASNDQFGYSIGIDNGVVAVGAPRNRDNGGGSGSAYLFDATTGTEIAKLLPDDGAAHDRFGWSIAIGDGVVAVGAYLDDDLGFNSGSVYLFDALTGQQFHKIVSSSGGESQWFGWSIDIDGGILAVSSLYGSDYLFDVSTGTQLAKISASDRPEPNTLGWSVAINDKYLAVGAIFDQSDGVFTGSAYMFDLACPADLTEDFILDFFDVAEFLEGYAATDPIADFTDDGIFNFFDVAEFLEAFYAGCP